MKKNFILLCFLAFSVSVTGQTVSLRKITDLSFLRGGWNAFQMNGYLYSFDIYNTLQKTNLSDGTHARLGNELFTNIRNVFGVNNRLYIIETNGSMKRIDPQTGISQIVSPVGTWSLHNRFFVLGNSFFSIMNGVLCSHPSLDPGTCKQIGKADYANLGVVFREDAALHTVIGNALYEVSLQTGEYKKICQDKSFRSLKAGAVINGKLYSIENPPAMMETNLKDGKRTEIDNKLFLNARLLFNDSGKLFYVDSDYILSEVVISSN